MKGILVFCCFILIGFTANGQTLPPAFAIYSFDDGTARDEAGIVDGAAIGTVSPAADRFGNPAHALQFTDASAISFGDNFDIFSTPDAQFSFSLWIKKQDLTTTNVLFLSKYGNSNCGEQQREFFIRFNDEQRIEFLFYSDIGSAVFHGYEAQQSFNDTCWHHVVINYDGSLDDNQGLDRVAMYVDGDEIDTRFSSNISGEVADIENSTSHLSLGTPLNSNGELCFFNSFIGLIDDLYFFDQNLSAAEVGALFRTPSPTGEVRSVNALFNLSEDLICQNECVQIEDQSFSGLCENNSTWIFPGGQLSEGAPEQPQSICFPEAGIFQVIHIMGNEWAQDTFIQSVSVIPNTIDILGNDTLICEGERLTLNAEVTNGAYLWSTGSTDPQVSLEEAGEYWVEITADGCPQRDTLQLDVLAVPSVDLGPNDSICEGETLLLDATSDIAEAYLWQDGSTEPGFTADREGTFSVEVGNQCGSVSDEINIAYLARRLTVNLGGDQGICEGDSITIDGTTPNAGAYLWSNGATTPVLTTSTPGIYQLTASNECFEDTDEIQITDQDCCAVFVPNIFSPNGDGNNDVFQVFTDCDILSFRLKIFDRWGSLVYESNDLNRGWNGLINNQILPKGVYTWFIEYDDGTGDQVDSGSVMLIR